MRRSFNLEIALKTGRRVPEESLCQINLLDSTALSEVVLFFYFKTYRREEGRQDRPGDSLRQMLYKERYREGRRAV